MTAVPEYGRKRPPAPPETPDLIWGIHPVLSTLQANPHAILEIILEKQPKPGSKIEEIVRSAEQAGVALRYGPVTERGVDRNASHQGVAARIKSFQTISLDELLAKLQGKGPALLLALDSIQDPHNLGAIIRTALAAGVHGLIITKDRAAPLSGTAAKASAGAIVDLPICRVTNLVIALQKLKDAGIWVFGAALGGETIYRTDFATPLCLVIGGEDKGLRPLVMKQCDFLVTIPMPGRLNSLNASVAAGVVLFEIVRQRSR